MLRIRLQRTGRKNQPSFRMVVLDRARGPKTGRIVERVGFYNPLTKEKDIDTARVSHWLSVGAQPSGTVHNMLVDAGIIKSDKKNVLPHKSPVVPEAAEEEAKPEEVATEAGEKTEQPAEDAEAKQDNEETSTEEKTEEKQEETKPQEETEEVKEEPQETKETTEETPEAEETTKDK